MARWLADENFNDDIVRAVQRAKHKLDLIRAQDAGLSGVSDDWLLNCAAGQGRFILTHDVTTLTAAAYDRVRKGLAMPGVFAVSPSTPIRRVVEDILLLSEGSRPGEWEGQVRYLPLK
jgi:Domain of unknown function (DUF5615)